MIIDILIQAEKLRVEQKSKSLMYIDPSAFRCSSAGSRICESVRGRQEVTKGTWWMPGLLEAMKDVISCDKPRRGANGR